MVILDAVKKSNLQLRNISYDVVALITGGTSGIGAAVAKELAKNFRAPRIYIVGRNANAAALLSEDVGRINSNAQIHFLSADLSLLKNAYKATQEFLLKEPKKLNFLILSSGQLDMGGRQETEEGIDKKMAISYYGRMLFIRELLPHLRAAASASELARVMSVLAAGKEKEIAEDDLEIKKNYNKDAFTAHAAIMTDFAIERFALENPSVGFVHLFPGLVKTNIFSNMPAVFKIVLKVMDPVLNRFVFVPIDESAARNVFHLTSGRYKAKVQAESGQSFIDLPESASFAIGSNGEIGSGAYLLHWDGESTGVKAILEHYRERKVNDKIWQNLQEVFKRVLV